MNTKTKALFAFGALFIAGFASGFIFSNSISQPDTDYSEFTGEQTEQTETGERWQRAQRTERGERQADRARNRLSGLLDLTSDQETSFFEHMAEYRASLRSAMREMRVQENELVNEHYDALRNELTLILTTEQLEKLDSHVHPDSVRHHRMRGGRPGIERD